MSNACDRKLKVGEGVYILDHWSSQANLSTAEILSVDEDKKTFTALLYGDTYQKYKFEDYGHLFFDKFEKAEKAVEKLPKSGTEVYQISGKRVYTKTAIGIGGRQQIDGTYELVIYLNKGNEVPFKEMGSTLFLDKQDARRNIK